MSQTKVAKIISVHGLRGAVVIYSLSEKFDWLRKKLQLSDQDKKENKFYNVTDFRVQGKKAIVYFKEITDRNSAESAVGTELHIDSSKLISKKSETIFLSEILGFKVKDKVYGELGNIKSFGSNGPQDLLCVSYSKGDLEIPFVPEMVIEIDFKEKILFTDLPDQYVETFYPNK